MERQSEKHTEKHTEKQTEKYQTTRLPDVALEDLGLDQGASLDWVGMKEIEVPVLVSAGGLQYQAPARVDAGVSLDSSNGRGIHMSRLYKEVQDLLSIERLSHSLLEKLLAKFLSTHYDMSVMAKVSVHFPLMLQRKALKSENFAWRTYPVTLSARQNRGEAVQHFIEVEVIYSSTCPASAALARQLIQENFKSHFLGSSKQGLVEISDVYEWLGSSQGILATPHAQRSSAKVKIEMKIDMGPPEDLQELCSAETLINLLEEVLQTPVQGIVKREDEQEFALRNGQNLMFCEDAGRRVKLALESKKFVSDYCGEFRHMESLHPHDAASLISKGLQLSFDRI